MAVSQWGRISEWEEQNQIFFFPCFFLMSGFVMFSFVWRKYFEIAKSKASKLTACEWLSSRAGVFRRGEHSGYLSGHSAGLGE